MFSLCSFCNKRLGLNLNTGDCYICKNNLERFYLFLENLSLNLKDGIKYFSLSSQVSKDVLLREEDVFDLGLGESIRNEINIALRRKLEEKLKFLPDNGDIVFNLNFPSLTYSYSYLPLYIYGAYRKLIPGISQKRWKYETSVEELIGKPSSTYTNASSYTLHASGREDVDAINTGFRPFVLELENPTKRICDLKELEEIINKENMGRLEVKLYGRVKKSFVTLVSDSHFDKCYRAYLSIKNDFEKLKEIANQFKNKTIYQKTPTRVLSRRGDRVRKRKVYFIKPGKDQYGIYLDICCEAGLYIKELISGDNGRTKPSISELLGKPVFCSFLIVTNINYSFLNKMFEYDRIRC